MIIDGYVVGQMKKAMLNSEQEQVKLYDAYYNKGVTDGYQQGRANAIEECINTLYEVAPQTIDQKLDMVFVNALKRLKEQE